MCWYLPASEYRGDRHIGTIGMLLKQSNKPMKRKQQQEKANLFKFIGQNLFLFTVESNVQHKCNEHLLQQLLQTGLLPSTFLLLWLLEPLNHKTDSSSSYMATSKRPTFSFIRLFYRTVLLNHLSLSLSLSRTHTHI